MENQPPKIPVWVWILILVLALAAVIGGSYWFLQSTASLTKTATPEAARTYTVPPTQPSPATFTVTPPTATPSATPATDAEIEKDLNSVNSIFSISDFTDLSTEAAGL